MRRRCLRGKVGRVDRRNASAACPLARDIGRRRSRLWEPRRGAAQAAPSSFLTRNRRCVTVALATYPLAGWSPSLRGVVPEAVCPGSDIWNAWGFGLRVGSSGCRSESGRAGRTSRPSVVLGPNPPWPPFKVQSSERVRLTAALGRGHRVNPPRRVSKVT